MKARKFRASARGQEWQRRFALLPRKTIDAGWQWFGPVYRRQEYIQDYSMPGFEWEGWASEYRKKVDEDE